jgi:hypothetical protein
MTDQDLQRLITAYETDNDVHFHGDTREATIDALKELQTARETLAEIADLLPKKEG